MTMLLNQIITGAVTAQLSGTLQMRGSAQMSYPDSLIIQGNLTYGSGGTTIDVWVQTSIDGGTNLDRHRQLSLGHVGKQAAVQPVVGDGSDDPVHAD
jgi:hypothetical protein